MFTLIQRFLNSVTTTAAILRSEGGRNETHHATSIFRFVRVDIEKRIPCRIRDAFSEMMILHHPRNIQILKGKGVELSQQIKRAFVKEVVSLPRYLQVLFRQKPNSFPAIAAPMFLTRDGALRGLQPPFGLPQILWILNPLARRKSSEVLDTNIQTDTLPCFREIAARVFFDSEDNVPTLGFALNRASLDCTFNGTGETHAATPNLGERQFVAVKFETTLWIAKRIVASLASKARIACLLSRFRTTKESKERFVEAAQSVLPNLAINRRYVWVCFAHVSQLAALFSVAHRLARYAVGITSVLQTGVIQVTADPKRALKSLSGALGCANLVFIRLHRANYSLRGAFSAS